jgi:hypothetical protein
MVPASGFLLQPGCFPKPAGFVILGRMELSPPPDAPPLDQWNPKVRRLYEHWHSLRPEPGLLPGRQHFDPLAVVELMPNLWMLGVDEETGRYRYRLVGTGMVEAMGRDLTGQWYDEAHPGAAEHPMHAYLQARILAGIPTWRRGPPWLHVDPNIYEIEQILLPLAKDGRSVDVVLAITVFSYASGKEARR